MSDILKRRTPEDTKRINIKQDWECDYWCSELGCMRAQLNRAVSIVGPMVADVKTWLRDH